MFGVLIVLAVAAAGCGSNPSAAVSQSGGSAAAPTSSGKPSATQVTGATSAQAGIFKADAEQWARIKEGAAKEGRAVVAGPPFPNLRQAIVQGVQRAFGITVDYIGLPSGEAQVSLDREAKAGKATIDISLSGVGYTYTVADEQLIFDDTAKLVVDPEVLNPAAWREGAPHVIKPMPGASKDFHPGLQGADWVMTDLFVNRDTVPQLDSFMEGPAEAGVQGQDRVARSACRRLRRGHVGLRPVAVWGAVREGPLRQPGGDVYG